ncbi:MAG: NAD(P)H-binding protein [Rhodomicrobium sp.]|nr:NAD(P)H-binding protein [Rhodomicrobium sp.]
MNLFVTGATDVLGKAVLRQLVSKGHNIKALSRSDGNRASLIEWDAAPVEADVFDPASLASAFEGCEAVLHLATKIPAIADMKKPGIWTENDRLRRDGMRAIVTAARETAGLHTIIYPSVSFFYADSATGGSTRKARTSM